jgi:carbon monoxide dehydrogenase subunit G
MSLVTASIQIGVAPEKVWEMVMDPDRLGDWVTIHRRLLHADGGPVRLGYEMDQLIHLRGVNLEVHWRLVNFATNELAVWEGRGPAHSHAHSEYRLSAAEGGTRFDYRNEFRAPLGPVGAIVSRALVGGVSEREANRTLARLCAYLEPDGAGN